MSKIWRRLLDAYLGREEPADPRIWHKWTVGALFGVRLVNGERSAPNGQLWRRLTDAGWEYRQDTEATEEWESRGV